MKKPKTLKDIYDKSKQSYISDEADEVVEDLCVTMKEWIKFLEAEGQALFTDYPQGTFQATILREIFNIEG